MISATLLEAQGDTHTYLVCVESKRAAGAGDDSEDAEFRVTLTQDFYEQLCAGGVTREWVLVRAFNFLLARETVEQILPRFDLRQISDYFPEFVATLQEELLQK